MTLAPLPTSDAALPTLPRPLRRSPWLGGLTLHPRAAGRVHVAAARRCTRAATVRLPRRRTADGGWVLADERGDRRSCSRLRGPAHDEPHVRRPAGRDVVLLALDGRTCVELDAPTTAAHRRRGPSTSRGARSSATGAVGQPATLLGVRRVDGLPLTPSSGAPSPGPRQRRPVADRRAARAAGRRPRHDRAVHLRPGRGTYGPDRRSPRRGRGLVVAARPRSARAASRPTAPTSSGLARRRATSVAGAPDVGRRRLVSRLGGGTSAFDGRWSGRTPDHVVLGRSAPAAGWALLALHVGGDCVRAAGLSGDPLGLPVLAVSPGDSAVRCARRRTMGP